MVRFSPEDPIMSDHDLLTAAELAARLQVKPGTVLQWQRAGRIPAVRITAKVLRFNLSAVLTTLGNQQAARPEGVAHA